MLSAGRWSVVGAVLVAAGPLLAGEPLDLVKEGTEAVLDVVRNPDLKDPAKTALRRDLIEAAVEDRFAWTEMAQRALGARQWKALKEPGRQEFIALFRELVQGAYIREIEEYSGEQIRYDSEKVEGDFAVARVTFISSKNVEVPIEYRLFKRKPAPRPRTTTRPAPAWVVYDFTVLGMSFVNNYRVQIRDILARSPYEELLKRLRAKIAELSAPEPAPDAPADGSDQR